eukprot:CAMPEP_0114618148 /NCGR_PEP_ID=MMETSP0168-20121206/7557_1 /TAXON_ID=95228 ORGANISM="Vannella sp., Strain DIVA3 517/6/12" /NCGR_SAMPLE_ID=MMETSP0168 /ASSEMBLY_ACC=CAM_ASM_000044 /LENGTH=58 /DNA_ID=CAMNT_0001829293 /DNA_START=408 /DNA_END=580 /DNA_ORIENTATION=+
MSSLTLLESFLELSSEPVHSSAIILPEPPSPVPLSSPTTASLLFTGLLLIQYTPLPSP